VCRDLTFFAAVLVAACAGDDRDCVDPDRDGRGEGCAGGPDCDEHNPLRHDDCEAVPAPDCQLDPIQPGCRCFTRRPHDCWLGPAEARGIGACADGVIECALGYWGDCAGQRLPAAERCDGQDEDCDGVVDDGVESPCGGCDPGCLGAVTGPGGAPFSAEGGEGVAVGPDGALVLAALATEARALWVADSGEDAVSRIDTEARVEVARYPSGGRDPSRTAVDYRGDAYVANRAWDAQATVTKIAGLEQRCDDRDRDGTRARRLRRRRDSGVRRAPAHGTARDRADAR